MIGQPIPVTIVTHEHLFHGTLTTLGERLLDILNNGLTDLLRLKDVRVCTCQTGASEDVHLQTATIRKSAVNIVILRSSGHEAPGKRWDNYVEKLAYRAYLIVPGCEIEGTVRLNRTELPDMAVLQQPGEFMAVTMASLTYSDGNKEQAFVVMVRRSSIGLLYVGEEDVVRAERQQACFWPSAATNPSTL
ncbi:MAG: hypothetical protein GX557_05375 [Chloroflexi bacterium]|nr:hypothetical protein [Chloroflexota bacterium]